MKVSNLAVSILAFTFPAIAEEPRSEEVLPPGAVQRLGTPVFRAPSHIMSLRYTPDGKSIAACTINSHLIFWDAKTGRVQRSIEEHARTLSFSPDGKRVALAGTSGGVRDVGTFASILRFPTNDCEVIDVCWSPNGKLLAAFDCGAILVIRDSETGEEVARFDSEWASEGSLSWTADSARVACIGPKGEAELLEVATKKVLARVPKSNNFDAEVAVSPSGDLLLRGNTSAGCLVWDVKSRSRRTELETFIGDATRFTFSPDGTSVAAIGGGRTRVLDLATRAVLFDSGPGGGAGKACFSPDGKNLAVSAGGGVRVWNLADGAELDSGPAGTLPVRHLVWTSDGKKLLAEGRGKAANLWTLKDGSAQVLKDSRGFFCLSDDGVLLAERKGEDRVRVWDISSGETAAELKRPDTLNPSICFLPASHLLLIPEQSLVQVIDCDSGKTVGTFGGGTRNTGLELCPSRGRVASFSYEEVKVWDSATFKEIASIAATEKSGISGGDISRDGSLLVLVRGQGELAKVELRVADSQKLVWSINHPDEAAASSELPTVRFSPDVRMVVLLSRNRVSLNDYWLRVVETGSGHDMWQIKPPTPIESFAFSPDSQQIALGLQNGMILIYSAGPTDLSRTATVDSLLADLTSDDAPTGWRAAWSLARLHPDALLDLRNRLMQPVEDSAASALLPDLDSEDPTRRDAATKSLLAMGTSAEATLAKALKGKITDEARGRINEILAALRGPGMADPLSRMVVRGIAALEYLGTQDAKAVLQLIADDNFSSKARAEAKEALRRLDRGR